MSMTPLLRCHDRTQTERFYVDVLGFAAVDSEDDTLTVEKQGGKLIFTQQDLWKSAPTCSGTFYFALADVAAYYAAVKDGASIAWPLQQMPYGSSEFGLLDCNG
jgi:uncharacterized glyoxalase superfamily protein PhnB